MNKQEVKSKNAVDRFEQKKRWETPCLSRLDFPKTAANPAGITSADNSYEMS